jgi:DNA recombination protein RmuC
MVITLETLVLIIAAVIFVFMCVQCGFLIWYGQLNTRQQHSLKENMIDRLATLTQTLEHSLNENLLRQSKESAEIQKIVQEQLKEISQHVEKRLATLTHTLEERLNENLLRQSKESGEIQKMVQEQLRDISHHVDKRLSEGFEKTTATFTDIVKRLALIDDAQKKLSELSSSVVSLQEILVDKRSRGAFGEMQLKNIVENMLPQDRCAFQHTLSNGMRADCILFLPEPTGHIVIDSKFPLENFQLMTDFDSTTPERKKAQQDFKVDIKKHINDIASKYIIVGETTNGAVLFIPAEAVFAEIHAHFPDLVEFAHRLNVWLASPTTLMAILTTARSVLKDFATKQHIHVIQEHLRHLAKDFNRFETRMDNLAKHIDQAQKDVQHVHTSAKKISSRFIQIEKADLPLTLE